MRKLYKLLKEKLLYRLIRMPYKLVKVKSGYYVVNKMTGKKHSSHPLPKERAEAQMRVLDSIYKASGH